MYTVFGLLIYFAHDYRLAALAAVLWGWGGETLWATGPAQVINVTDPKRRGSIAGLFQSSTYSGQMLGVLLFGYILSRYADPARGQDVILLVAVGISLGRQRPFALPAREAQGAATGEAARRDRGAGRAPPGATWYCSRWPTTSAGAWC